MSIQIEWLDGQHHTLVMTYGDNWTWDEHFAAQEKAFRLVQSMTTPVSIIVDVSNVTTPPERVLVQLPEIARYITAAQLQQIIIVGLHGLLETAARIYTRAYHSLTTVDTLEEAVRLARS